MDNSHNQVYNPPPTPHRFRRGADFLYELWRAFRISTCRTPVTSFSYTTYGSDWSGGRPTWDLELIHESQHTISVTRTPSRFGIHQITGVGRLENENPGLGPPLPDLWARNAALMLRTSDACLGGLNSVIEMIFCGDPSAPPARLHDLCYLHKPPKVRVSFRSQGYDNRVAYSNQRAILIETAVGNYVLDVTGEQFGHVRFIEDWSTYHAKYVERIITDPTSHLKKAFFSESGKRQHLPLIYNASRRGYYVEDELRKWYVHWLRQGLQGVWGSGIKYNAPNWEAFLMEPDEEKFAQTKVRIVRYAVGFVEAMLEMTGSEPGTWPDHFVLEAHEKVRSGWV